MRVALLAVDGMFDSGLTSVLDVLAAANGLRDDRPPFQTTIVGLTDAAHTGHGLRIATTPLSRLTTQPDLVICPAAGLTTPDAVISLVRDHPCLAWLRAQHERRTALAAACSGTFFLAEAGVLDGVLATTSWWLGARFRARYPAVRLDERLTIAEDGRITTAAAAFAHIDLALAIVARHSPELAERVCRYLLIGERPSQAALAIPAQLANGNPTVTSFERWVRDHLREPVRIGRIAGELGVSERALQRATGATLGMSPLDFVHEIRIDQALFLLRTTSQSPEAVALAVGYANVSSLRALIRRRRNATLTQLTRGSSGGR